MELERELGHQSIQLESLTEEKVRLLREIAQLRAAGKSVMATEDSQGGYYYNTSQQQQSSKPTSSPNANLVPKVSNNSTITSVGALRLYEFMLGIFFIAAMMNWILV